MNWEVLTMKLRISFFNPSVLKKDATRFFPVWGLYSILLLILYFMLTDNAVGAGEIAYNMVDMIPISAVINFGYGLLCAFVLFGDLFNSRLCNALHAMPMRREGWFATHLTAGLLFMAVPNGVFALITGLQMESYAYISLWWLATACMQFLFFFGVAVLAMLCAGNRLGATALYGIFNFLPALIYVLFESFYLPALPGIVNDWENYGAFIPVYEMASATYLDYENSPYRYCPFGDRSAGYGVYAYNREVGETVFSSLKGNAFLFADSNYYILSRKERSNFYYCF